MIAPEVDLATLVMDSRNIVFCNYFVAKPTFWRVWLENCEAVFAIAEEGKTALAAGQNADTPYKGGGARKVFLIERIASLLLSTRQHWKTKAYNPTLLPYAPLRIAQYPQELLQMDALKMAMLAQGYPQYMSMFSQIQQSILKRMQQVDG